MKKPAKKPRGDDVLGQALEEQVTALNDLLDEIRRAGFTIEMKIGGHQTAKFTKKTFLPFLEVDAWRSRSTAELRRSVAAAQQSYEAQQRSDEEET